jgi:isopentenyl diphosphate isomerase/L-lactate dehydrogenase-like FMN-dependent dehydrogenase
MANMSLQEVAAQAQHPCMLFQLYVIRDRQIVEGWVRQAEAAGYKALVITVDAPRLGRREADERNRWAACGWSWLDSCVHHWRFLVLMRMQRVCDRLAA